MALLAAALTSYQIVSLATTISVMHKVLLYHPSPSIPNCSSTNRHHSDQERQQQQRSDALTQDVVLYTHHDMLLFIKVFTNYIN